MALFKLATERVSLSWSAPRTLTPRTALGELIPPGGVRVVYARAGAAVSSQSWPQREGGPYLYEQTDYRVLAQSLSGERIELRHRDPVLLQELDVEDDGLLVHGIINYGSQIGMTRWELWERGQLELAFELEVFPTKLTYREDYDAILSQVQGLLTGLALEYLRATWQSGRVGALGSPSDAVTDVEWLTSLRLHIDAMEQALEQIRRQPLRQLQAHQQWTPLSQARATDKGARSALSQGRGQGAWVELEGALRARERILVERAAQSLLTPEQRWVAQRLRMLHRKLLSLLETQRARQRQGARGRQVVRELEGFVRRVGRWRQQGPWAQRSDDDQQPILGQTLALWRTPGYAELAQISHALELGLWVDGGPLAIGVKDLSRLYEYWCYLMIVRLMVELTGGQPVLDELLVWRIDGLSVRLGTGQESVVEVALHAGAKLRLIYNPSLTRFSLHPQRPDMLLSVLRPGWPALHLVMDAKYRLDPHGEVGPPMDAINALHRYRDAILQPDEATGRLEHGIVQAVALFPYREPEDARGSFEQNRLWSALEDYGVGALPMLPGELEYVRRWLSRMLARAGWSLADGAIGHAGARAVAQARRRADELTLVGVLRAKSPEQHLAWIDAQRLYYTPYHPTQPRQLAARYLTIYSPRALRSPGAITHIAPILAVELTTRAKVATPWDGSRGGNEQVVLYHLGALEVLSSPVENDAHGEVAAQRFSVSRWSTRYAIERARHVGELVMELVQEWQLYEALQERGVQPRLEALPSSAGVDARGVGRARFCVGDVTARWGARGYELRRAGQDDEHTWSLERALVILGHG